MGCVSIKSRLKKIRDEKKEKGKKLQQYNAVLNQLEQEVQKLDDQGRKEEADLKEQEYEILKQEKQKEFDNAKDQNIKLGKLDRTKQLTNKVVQDNIIDKIRLKEMGDQIEILEERDIIDQMTKEMEDHLRYRFNVEDYVVGEDTQNKLNRNPKNRQTENLRSIENQKQDRCLELELYYPPSNAAYPFEQLTFDYSHNNQRIQQPQISQVQSFLQN